MRDFQGYVWVFFVGCCWLAVAGLVGLVFNKLCDLNDRAPRARRDRR